MAPPSSPAGNPTCATTTFSTQPTPQFIGPAPMSTARRVAAASALPKLDPIVSHRLSLSLIVLCPSHY
ncbi:hypothetical protein L484_007476 [Morus notabilis]|uniref:Uncharacterized protein n=1 Tax=Morus notabilis TaxID=981085 RepID=W9SA35_9ROSA|nr:hypothetical protein L484_007476 [Morus notabilis]